MRDLEAWRKGRGNPSVLHQAVQSGRDQIADDIDEGTSLFCIEDAGLDLDGVRTSSWPPPCKEDNVGNADVRA